MGERETGCARILNVRKISYTGLVHISPLLHQQLRHFGVTIASSREEWGAAIILKGGVKLREMRVRVSRGSGK